MLTSSTNNLSERLFRYLGATKITIREFSDRAKVCPLTVGKVLNREKIENAQYWKIDEFISGWNFQEEAPMTFKKLPRGYVFLYPNDSRFLPPKEKESVRLAFGMLNRGRQYYIDGNVFFPLEGIREFEEP